mgnify:CR=1 FL=1
MFNKDPCLLCPKNFFCQFIIQDDDFRSSQNIANNNIIVKEFVFLLIKRVIFLFLILCKHLKERSSEGLIGKSHHFVPLPFERLG